MEEIKRVEIEINILRHKMKDLNSKNKGKNNDHYFLQIKEINEKIETRKQFIQAIIKNIETSNHFSQYLVQQERTLPPTTV